LDFELREGNLAGELNPSFSDLAWPPNLILYQSENFHLPAWKCSANSSVQHSTAQHRHSKVAQIRLEAQLSSAISSSDRSCIIQRSYIMVPEPKPRHPFLSSRAAGYGARHRYRQAWLWIPPYGATNDAQYGMKGVGWKRRNPFAVGRCNHRIGSWLNTYLEPWEYSVVIPSLCLGARQGKAKLPA